MRAKKLQSRKRLQKKLFQRKPSLRKLLRRRLLLTKLQPIQVSRRQQKWLKHLKLQLRMLQLFHLRGQFNLLHQLHAQ